MSGSATLSREKNIYEGLWDGTRRNAWALDLFPLKALRCSREKIGFLPAGYNERLEKCETERIGVKRKMGGAGERI